MDILDALQDIRARNARNERVAQGPSAELLDKIARDEVESEEQRTKRLEDEEDEMLVREVFSKVAAAGPSSAPPIRQDSPEEDVKSTPTLIVKRKADGEAPGLHKLLSDDTKALLVSRTAAPPAKKKKTNLSNALGIKVVKKGKAPAKAVA